MPKIKHTMTQEFSSFLSSAVRIWDAQADDVFYVYPDKIQNSRKLPESLDDAYGDGWLIVEATSPGFYTLTIGNQSYIDSSRYNLELVLFDWAKSEGYRWQ